MIKAGMKQKEISRHLQEKYPDTELKNESLKVLIYRIKQEIKAENNQSNEVIKNNEQKEKKELMQMIDDSISKHISKIDLKPILDALDEEHSVKQASINKIDFKPIFSALNDNKKEVQGSIEKTNLQPIILEGIKEHRTMLFYLLVAHLFFFTLIFATVLGFGKKNMKRIDEQKIVIDSLMLEIQEMKELNTPKPKPNFQKKK